LASERPVCDHTKGLVAVDGVFGALFGTAALAVADDSSGAALVLGIVAASYVGSAIHGNGVVDECNEASGAWEQDYARARPSLPPDEDVASAPPARMRMRPPVAPLSVPAATPAAVAEQPTPPPPVAAPTPPPPKQRDANAWSSFWEETP
jgi:hypothetical protein